MGTYDSSNILVMKKEEEEEENPWQHQSSVCTSSITISLSEPNDQTKNGK